MEILSDLLAAIALAFAADALCAAACSEALVQTALIPVTKVTQAVATEILLLPKAKAVKSLSLKKAAEMYLLRELKSVYLEELSAYRQFFIKYIRKL